jgi:hypothetical protein
MPEFVRISRWSRGRPDLRRYPACARAPARQVPPYLPASECNALPTRPSVDAAFPIGRTARRRLPLYRVDERRLDHLPSFRASLARPIAEGGSETMRHHRPALRAPPAWRLAFLAPPFIRRTTSDSAMSGRGTFFRALGKTRSSSRLIRLEAHSGQRFQRRCRQCNSVDAACLRSIAEHHPDLRARVHLAPALPR